MRQTELDFLQSLTEAELCELVLLPLLSKLGYHDIRNTHGILEYGKDIVFSSKNPLEGVAVHCACVKRFKLNGTVSDSRSVREVYYQVSQSFSEPFIDPFDGREVAIDKVFVISSYEITQGCIRSIAAELRTQSSKEVRFIDGPHLVDLIREYLPGLLTVLPDPTERYLLSLHNRFMEIQYLTSLGSHKRLTLLDVYTGGRISPIDPDEARYVSFVSQKDPPPGAEPRQILATSPFLTIIADVGAGKTTLLRKLAIDMTGEERARSHNGSDHVPVFVSLASVPSSSVDSFGEFRTAVVNAIANELGSTELFNLRRGSLLLLLDGFDELPTGHSHAERYLARLADVFPSGIVVTSRPSRIPKAGEPFRYYRLLPFGLSQIREFLARWFGEDQLLAENVYERIAQNPSLLAFCHTPLMLTLYAILAQRISLDSLPVRRTDIYQSITQLLLGDWDRMRNIRNHFSVELKAQVLESLAFDTHREGMKSFDVRKITRTCERISELRGLKPDQGRPLIDEIVYRSSLIVPTTYSGFTFVHLSFQEFFTAKRMLRSTESGIVGEYLLDDWWRQVWVFYFGLRRSMDGIKWPVRRRRLYGHGLRLMEFLTEADYTESRIRDEILDIVSGDLLGVGDLSEAEIDVCRRIGDDVVDAIRRAVSKDGLRRGVTHYFDLLLRLNTSHSHQVLNADWGRLCQEGVLVVTSVIRSICRGPNLEANSRFALWGFEYLQIELKDESEYSFQEREELGVAINDTLKALSEVRLRTALPHSLVETLDRNARLAFSKFHTSRQKR